MNVINRVIKLLENWKFKIAKVRSGELCHLLMWRLKLDWQILCCFTF